MYINRKLVIGMNEKEERKNGKTELLKKFIGKKVLLTCVFGTSPPIFYNAIIKNVLNDSVLIVDKFGKELVIDLDSIKKVEER
jgi:hypothetical protein